MNQPNKGCGCKDCQAKYPPEHTHKFTVPVEFMDRKDYDYPIFDQHKNVQYLSKKVVSKLRCESCPEEIER